MANDIFDLWTFLRVGDLDAGSKNQELLGDLRDRAQYLAKKTGQEPISFYEFKMQQPQKEPKSGRNILVGIGLGAAFGALISLSAAGVGAIPGAIAGGFIGAFSDTQNLRRTDQVKAYSNYLDNFEHQIILQRGVEKMVQQGVSNHVERVVAGRTLNQAREI